MRSLRSNSTFLVLIAAGMLVVTGCGDEANMLNSSSAMPASDALLDASSESTLVADDPFEGIDVALDDDLGMYDDVSMTSGALGDEDPFYESDWPYFEGPPAGALGRGVGRRWNGLGAGYGYGYGNGVLGGVNAAGLGGVGMLDDGMLGEAPELDEQVGPVDPFLVGGIDTGFDSGLDSGFDTGLDLGVGPVDTGFVGGDLDLDLGHDHGSDLDLGVGPIDTGFSDIGSVDVGPVDTGFSDVGGSLDVGPVDMGGAPDLGVAVGPVDVGGMTF